MLFTILGINTTAKNVFAEIEEMKEFCLFIRNCVVAFNHKVAPSTVGMLMFTVEDK